MTDKAEIEALVDLANAWGEVNLAQGRESQSRDMAKIATALTTLLAERDAAVARAEKAEEEVAWQAEQRNTAFQRRHLNAPEDPHVLALCERHGYGAVMDAASRLWARRDSLGAFYIGGCIGVRAALPVDAGEGK